MKTSDYYALSREIAHLNSAYALLYWDMETSLPKGGAQWRAETLGHFAGLLHAKTCDPAYEEALERALSVETESVRKFALTRGLKDLRRSKRLPQKLVEDLSRVTALSQNAWSEAKDKKDFSLFAPHLTEVIKLTQEKAQLLSEGRDLYDTLLDEYSPGMTQKEIDPLFENLKQPLSQLLGQRKKSQFASWSVPITVQEKLCDAVIDWFGFKRDELTCGKSAHPFSLSLHPSDVRVTTRYQVDDPLMSVMSMVHELGHALYENQLEARFPGTPLAKDGGMDIHESQSRIWEVCLATSREFFEWVHAWFQQNAPEHLAGQSAEDLFRRASVVKPSLIRTEADPVTYGFHIMIRYHLEKKILKDEVRVHELPELWNNSYQDLLGISPKHDGEGILQDSHWSSGGFGYFPSYLLGTMIACQFYETIRNEQPLLSNLVRTGDLNVVHQWLKTRVHQHGCGKNIQQVLLESTGHSLQTEPFLRFLKERFIA